MKVLAGNEGRPKDDSTEALLEAVESPAHAAEASVEANAEAGVEVAVELPKIDDYGEPLDKLIEIPTEDNGEPLVDIFKVCPRLLWAAESPRFNFERSGLARLSVAEMLKTAQELLPNGWRWQIVGAFRPMRVQKQMYDAARAELAEQHPDWNDELLTRYINVFSAPPIDATPPPHTTGGAVDLSIVDENGERLDMTSPYDIGWDSAPTRVAGLSETARANRELLISVLHQSGLTNFAGEWWHWSWGEPGWALRTGNPVALYGAVPADQIPDWSPP